LTNPIGRPRPGRTSAGSDLGDLDLAADLDLHHEGDAELRALAERSERPGAQTYLTGPTSTFEDGRYEHALEVLTTLIPSARIIDARSLFGDFQRWAPLPYGVDRLVFITADDETIGWGVYGEVYDAQEESLPVHLLDLDTVELVPARELHLVSTALVATRQSSWTRSHYVFRRWPFELFLFLGKLASNFRRRVA